MTDGIGHHHTERYFVLRILTKTLSSISFYNHGSSSDPTSYENFSAQSSNYYIPNFIGHTNEQIDQRSRFNTGIKR